MKIAKAWILILVLAAVQALLLAPHQHAIGLEEQACVVCQTVRAATADIPASPPLALPHAEWAEAEERRAPETPLFSVNLERGNPRSPPTA